MPPRALEKFWAAERFSAIINSFSISILSIVSYFDLHRRNVLIHTTVTSGDKFILLIFYCTIFSTIRGAYPPEKDKEKGLEFQTFFLFCFLRCRQYQLSGLRVLYGA